MSDMIFRQDAIDATWEKMTYTEQWYVLTEVRKRLKALPSAQPEQPTQTNAPNTLNALDCISRQAAIDALEREKTYSTAYRDGYTQTDYFKQYNMGLTDGIKALNKLPSAQPDYDLSGYSDRLWKAAYERGKAEAEPRWIPVEYRPPEFGKEVLISHKGTVSIDWLTQSEGSAYFFMSGAGIADIDAWMPLPKPYERGKDAEIH